MAVIVVKDEQKNVSEPAESGSNAVHVFFLLDETGSMDSVRKETITGFNEYVQTLKAKTPSIRMTLGKFNACSGLQFVVSDTPITDVPPLTEKTYTPDCGTPLYDAIGRMIAHAEKHCNGSDGVLIIIQTDGYENSSTEFTQASVKALIQKKTDEDGWTVSFIGADIDAHAVGTGIGLANTHLVGYSGDAHNVGTTFSNLANDTAHYCSSTAGMSAPQRRKAMFFRSSYR